MNCITGLKSHPSKTHAIVMVHVKSLGLVRYMSLKRGNWTMDRMLSQFVARTYALGASQANTSLSAITPEIIEIKKSIQLADFSDFEVLVFGNHPEFRNAEPRQYGAIVKKLNAEELTKWALKNK